MMSILQKKLKFSFLVIILAVFVLPSFTSAALPAGFEIESLASGLILPTSMAFSTDGRIFIAEKGGAVKVFKNGALLPNPLIQLSDVNTYGDRGLLGIAIDPSFSTNGYIYLLYTYENTPGTSIAGSKTGRLVRITVTGDTSNESTKVVLLGSVGGNLANPSCEDYAITSDCIPSDSLSHSVGGLRFGPDGKLYVTLGDGASFDYADPRSLRAQNIDSLAGKMLRINKDGTAPIDNPHYNGNVNSNRSKVYSIGLRNAFRFNWRPSNNALLAGDVGWSTWEEVNLMTAGGNYGWPCREGAGVTPAGLGCTPSSTATDPLYFYAHDVNGAGSVTGGAFPTGTAYPASFNSSYFFGDYAQNFIKRIEFNPTTNQIVNVHNFGTGVDGTDGPVEFLTGPEGNVYFLAIYTGELKRITYTLGNRQPIAVIGASPTSGLSPLTVNFSSVGSSDPDSNPLSFLWNFGDNTTSNLTNPAHTYNSNGSYLATLTVTDGQGGINTKSINITVGNQAPTAIINSPQGGDLYVANQNIQLNGSGTDPETGALSGGALVWQIIIHHNTHTHIIQTLTGSNPVFVAPDHGDPDVYVEVKLTVTDPAGLSNSTSVNMYLNNNTQTTGNLIPNHSVETADANPTLPQGWFKGGYGVNNAVFTYPVAGYDGLNAIRLDVSSFTDGDAKWYFSPVQVTQNTQYRFSDYYTSNTTSSVNIQFGYGNGSYTYINIGNLGVAAQWTKFETVFTTPAGAETLTVFHSLAGNGQLTTDNYSLMLASSTIDTTLPTVSVTSPTTGQSVSGSFNFTANANDNVGVAEVTFLIDGIATSTEDTTSPYSLTLNTSTLSNGAHTVSARAIDTSNNQTTSAAVSFTVANSGGGGGANLIVNASLDTVSTTTPTNPYAWNNGKWGTNTTTFTYPVAGQSGNGARVNITAYTSGDAKWYFNDVTVTPGQTYEISWYYKSTAISAAALRYTSSSGVLSYPTLASSLPISTGWTKVTYMVTIPAGITKLTVFPLLNRVGTLEVDDFSLKLPGSGDASPSVSITAPGNNATVSGTINITADSTDDVGVAGVQFSIDGTPFGAEDTTSPYGISWNTTSVADGSHTISALSRDTANNTTPASITVNVSNSTTTSANMIVNGNFETSNGSSPLGWTHGGWGQSTKVYTYPVVGQDGNKGAGITVSNYVDGDIKWAFPALNVTPGKVYRYTDYYKSSTISDIIGQYTLTDGSFFYFGLVKEIAPQANWTQVTGTFTPPIGVTKVTLFHLISANGTFAIDDASLVEIGTTTPATDLTPPLVSFISPLASSTVSGMVNITASSTDNVGVTYVVFALNGNIISPNITNPPYTFIWDSTTTIDGNHILKATTHDAAGNNTALQIPITVNNTTPPATTTGSNLIVNPGLESTAGNGDPTQWFKGGWGTNAVLFSYPVAGHNSAKGAKLQITSYTSGDAKWYFAPVAVTTGNPYTYSNYYTSDVPSIVTVRYTTSSGNFTYTDIATLPASAGWSLFTHTLIPPAGAVAVSVFHELRTVGNLTVDDYSLTSDTETSSPNAFSQGMVSLVFDDGWMSHYDTALPILNTANMKGVFGIVTLETLDALPTNSVENPFLENEAGDGTPIDWFKGGWGTNSAVYTYPVAGSLATKGANITITSYTDGDAKWFFKDIPIVDGNVYNFTHSYTSDVPTTLTARYNMGGGTYVYTNLATLPASPSWTDSSIQLTMPINSQSVTIFHRLASVGSLTIDNANFSKVQIFVDPSHVLQMYSQGHEISSHTRTHASLTTVSNAQMLDEVNLSKSDLTGMGITNVKTFIYPYGDYSPAIQSAIQSAGYIGARSVDRGFNDKATDKFALKIQQMGATVTFAQAKAWIDTAYDSKTWLTMMFHQIDNGTDPLAMTPSLFQQIVDYIASKNMPVVTLEQGVSQMNP